MNCQPSTSSLPNVSYSNVSSSFTNVPSTSDPCTSLSSANQEGFNNSTWPAVDNQFFDPRDVEGLDQEEDSPFSDGEEENIEDMEMRNKIQQCLILNRDYQVKRSTFFVFRVSFFQFRMHDVLKKICHLSLSLLCICTWMGQHYFERNSSLVFPQHMVFSAGKQNIQETKGCLNVVFLSMYGII